MFASFERSWKLVQASWTVLRAEKTLVVYPLVSMIATLLVVLVFAVPSFAAGLFDAMMQEQGGIPILGLVVTFLFYVVLYSVIFFCNTALIGAAMLRLEGKDPTLADGFRIASERAGSILGYALISATVGMILRAISERSGIIGQIVIGLIGFVWTIATALVVPVLVVENIGPVEAIKRSGALMKKTWGEQIIVNSGIGGVFGLLMVGIIFAAVLLSMGLGSAVELIIMIWVLAVIAIMALGLVSAALGGIFQAALYRYATQGTTNGFFDDTLLENAYRQKPKRRGLF